MTSSAQPIIATLLVTCLAGVCQAQTTTRVSVSSGGVQGNNWALDHDLSNDGLTVVFTSMASNLVAGDTNGVADVFVFDRQGGMTTRVSVATGGAQGDALCEDPVVSPDGRYIAFTSFASNLVGGDTNDVGDIFLHDRVAQTTTRISVGTGGAQANGTCSRASLSADGRFVAFESTASTLVAGDINGVKDIFVRDVMLGTTTLVSKSSGGAIGNDRSFEASIAGEGRFVAFSSWATNLVSPDSNGGTLDVFLHDLMSGTTTLVSLSQGGVAANGNSSGAAISATGRYVAFSSSATNLLPTDLNALQDVFVRDMATSIVSMVSVTSAGSQGNGISAPTDISSDGRFVMFSSLATNFVAGDANGAADVFLHDRATSITSCVSISSGGTQGNSNSDVGRVSDDGSVFAFASDALNLVEGDTNGVTDIFVHDRRPVVCTGDLNGDLSIDGADLSVLLARFGTSCN